MMCVQQKTLFTYADNEAHMQGHYFNWELTSTLHLDLFVGWQALLKMHQLKIFYYNSQNTWVDCDYEIWSYDYTFSKAVVSAWTLCMFILVTLKFEYIDATVGCAVQMLFSIFIAILKVKLNTLFIKNFLCVCVCNCRKPLNEDYTGNKIKEIQIEENWMAKSCFNS
jgi:hypothetical protein